MIRRLLLAALLGAALLPAAAAAQNPVPAHPWQQLMASGDTTGLVQSMDVSVELEAGVITATIEEHHFNGNTITLTERAALDDLDFGNGRARESNRSIHPHLGVVTFRCRGDASCVEYSTDVDLFFELPGPRTFGFFAQDRAMAEQALADLQRMSEGR